MSNKHYFIVSHTVDEYHSINIAIRESFEECLEVISHTSDWYCSKGSGTVKEIDENFNTCHIWVFNKNKVKSEYNF